MMPPSRRPEPRLGPDGRWRMPAEGPGLAALVGFDDRLAAIRAYNRLKHGIPCQRRNCAGGRER